MKTPSWCNPALAGLVCALCATQAAAASFTPLISVPPPKPILHNVAPGTGFSVSNLFDGQLKTEYASQDEGTNTTVSFQFAAPTRITGLRHVDRNDPATIAKSEMDFFDEAGQKILTAQISHANKKAGETMYMLPSPVTAVRGTWRVTAQGNKGLYSLGGAELSFFTSRQKDPAPKLDTLGVRILPFLSRDGSQPVQVAIEHHYLEPAQVTVRIAEQQANTVTLSPGVNSFEWAIPQVRSERPLPVLVQFEGQTIVTTNVLQAAIRPMTVYILPHSHTDIGYTEIQTAIEDKQVRNVVDGMAAAKRTASYPEGSRFVWNVEVGWAADLYLQRMNPQQRAEFFEAVKNGQVVLNGMYLNELTGLCRPEELVQLFRFATRMGKETGVPIDSVMISDVPGFTWGTLSAMAQAGIKYFSAAPNYFDRIGTILKEWENKPFYWVGPDGDQRVLVWIPFWGYAMSHIYHQMSPKLVADFYEGLEKKKYPYDIAYVRWAGHGDNAVPDPAICDFVKDWNARHLWPKFIIAGTGEAFRAFEKRYANKLPVVRGDWTPYWEDGAGSSALQTAQNRNSSDRLSQAATVYALKQASNYPVSEFDEAWRNVLLYSEHTWGAWCSVSGPERKETKEQWAIKKGYADKADEQSTRLLQSALGASSSGGRDFDLLNTLSWTRSELARIPKELSRDGDVVSDSRGSPVPSQRLSSGELAILAEEVPPLASKRYSLSSGEPHTPKRPVSATGATLQNSILRLRVDETTGAIVELEAGGANVVDAKNGEAVNDYRYLVGDDVKDLQRNGPVQIRVGEPGPLVASLIIESPAPGCNTLRRELRMVAGQDYVEVINTVDKARLQATNYFAKNGKESLNFAFPFNIPDGDMLIDLPIGAMRPEDDQIPSACKNWVTVGRWVDIANRRHGVTWVTLDAPLIDVGHISATMLNSQTNPEVWRKRIERTQRFYSWAMNNHWGTNYRAYQEGPTVFRFILRPHRGRTSPAEATRFATGFSQTLLPAPASIGLTPQSLLELSSEDVLITGLKPADEGNAWILRLYGASGKDKTVSFDWGERRPKTVFLSDTSEAAGKPIKRSVHIPGYGLVTVRAEF